jgi:hypothetical protein
MAWRDMGYGPTTLESGQIARITALSMGDFTQVSGAFHALPLNRPETQTAEGRLR